MGRIKELRDKVKAETATEDEKTELNELEEEAKVEDEEATEDEKSIASVADALLKVIEAKQVKSEKIVEEKAAEKEEGFAVEYKEMEKEDQLKSFYKALLSDDKEKLKVMTTERKSLKKRYDKLLEGFTAEWEDKL